MSRQNSGPDAQGQFPATRMSLEAIAARLTALDAGQAAMNGALGLMLDTLHVQTTLLRKLAEFAAEDAAPSPLLKTLQELTAAIMALDASVGDVERKFDQLAQLLAVNVVAPERDGAAGREMPDGSPRPFADEAGD